MKISEIAKIHAALLAMQNPAFKLKEETKLKVATAAVHMERVLQEQQRNLSTAMKAHDEIVNGEKASHEQALATLQQQIEAENARHAAAVAAHLEAFNTTRAALSEEDVAIQLPDLSAAEFAAKGTPPALIDAMKPLLPHLKP